jgi:hypothetical protein
MAAAESKDAAVPPERRPASWERLRLPAGEEAGLRLEVSGLRRSPLETEGGLYTYLYP